MKNGQKDAPAYIFKEIFGLNGIKITCESISPMASAGGMESSNAFIVALITMASILSGADLTYADIFNLAVKLENDELNGVTGGQGHLSSMLGGAYHNIWLSGLRVERQLISSHSSKSGNQPDQLKEELGSSSSSLSMQTLPDKKTGGIDWRELSMTIQPMGSFRGLDFGLPRLSRAEIERINIDSQIGQIKDMVRSGISPSGRRVKELVAACAQKGQISAYADDLLACIGDILKLEEETAKESSPELKEALVIAEWV